MRKITRMQDAITIQQTWLWLNHHYILSQMWFTQITNTTYSPVWRELWGLKSSIIPNIKWAIRKENIIQQAHSIPQRLSPLLFSTRPLHKIPATKN